MLYLYLLISFFIGISIFAETVKTPADEFAQGWRSKWFWLAWNLSGWVFFLAPFTWVVFVLSTKEQFGGFRRPSRFTRRRYMLESGDSTLSGGGNRSRGYSTDPTSPPCTRCGGTGQAPCTGCSSTGMQGDRACPLCSGRRTLACTHY